MTLIKGGKSVYGAAIGVMMLETQFPRIHGDMANAMTWPFPMHFRVVRGATPEQVVKNDPRLLIDDFIKTGQELIDMGADGLTTTCGFLALIQDQLKDALGVPVAASSLMQIPMVQSLLPAGKRVGVITISKSNLTKAHLKAAGAAPDTPVIGTDNGRQFTKGFLDNHTEIDFDKCRADILDAASELTGKFENIGAIVLECTNMAPYAADIRRQTGLPVFSIYTMITWFQSGLMPRKFPRELDDPRFTA